MFSIAKESGFFPYKSVSRLCSIYGEPLRAELFLTRGDEVLVADMVVDVTDPTRDAINEHVIINSLGWAGEGCANWKIHKYRPMQRGHNFIPLAI